LSLSDLPFSFLPENVSILVSILLSALVMFIIGAYKARVFVGYPGKSRLEMAISGTLSALISYTVGVLLKVLAE
jgi:VIT1/CCC1 family predicted Fe2+/Mn2+ transporter